jgi:hypothetical protein
MSIPRGGCFKNNDLEVGKIFLDFMRKSKLLLKKLYTFVSHFLKRVGPNRQAKKKGRPQKYEDAEDVNFLGL